MKTIDVADAAASLPASAQKGLKERVVVTQRGKPVFALMPLTEDDWEDLVVSKTASTATKSPDRSGDAYLGAGGAVVAGHFQPSMLRPRLVE